MLQWASRGRISVDRLFTYRPTIHCTFIRPSIADQKLYKKRQMWGNKSCQHIYSGGHMGAFSDYLENKIIDHTLRNTTFTAPATVYIALFTSTASNAQLEANTLTNEVTGGSYARQSAAFSAASGGSTSNTGTVTFSNLPAKTLGY